MTSRRKKQRSPEFAVAAGDMYSEAAESGSGGGTGERSGIVELHDAGEVLITTNHHFPQVVIDLAGVGAPRAERLTARDMRKGSASAGH